MPPKESLLIATTARRLTVIEQRVRVADVGRASDAQGSPRGLRRPHH
jgi:hypothetical protein